MFLLIKLNNQRKHEEKKEMKRDSDESVWKCEYSQVKSSEVK